MQVRGVLFLIMKYVHFQCLKDKYFHLVLISTDLGGIYLHLTGRSHIQTYLKVLL